MKRLLVLLALAIALPLAHATPIADKYAQLGGAGSFLGSPTIPETNAVTPSDSHGNQFAYCWDLNPALLASKGRPVVATATARIVDVDENFPSGNGNIGNVVIQRYGEGRYASYLHLAKGSYTSAFV